MTTLRGQGTGWGGAVRFFYRGESWPVAYGRVEAHPTVKVGITVALPATRQDWTDGWGQIALSTLAPAPAWATTQLTLVDEPAGKSFSVPMAAAEHVVPWDRPVPFGVVDGQEFNDLDTLVRAFCIRLGQVEVARPARTSACVVWCGSPALSPPIEWVVIQLRRRLLGARTDVPVTDAERKSLAAETPGRVYEELRKVLRLPETKDLGAGFLEALRQLVAITSKRLDSEVGRVTGALLRAFGVPGGGLQVRSVEDFAGTAMAVFFVALLAHGYRRGTVRAEDDPPLFRVGASLAL